MAEAPAPRIPDSHKQAFWIYGVTAMIMREPLGIVVRDISAKGVANGGVQMECLRMAVVLVVLSRQFLGAGVFFDRVYLQPGAAAKFPRRNYPVDFLTRLIEMLLAVAASTTVALETSALAGLTPFTIVTLVLLLLDGIWLAIARAARYSTIPEIAPMAHANLLVFLLCALSFAAVRASGFGSPVADAVILAEVFLFTGFQLAGQIRSYNRT